MRVVTVLLGLLALGFWAPLARAEEAKAAVSASMLLNILAPSTEPGAAALDQRLKDAGPAPRPPAGEVQPDGSVKYGPVVVTVRNPCPPGTAHYVPSPLPGRRPRS